MHFIPSYLNASAVLKWQSEGEGGFVVVVVGCVISVFTARRSRLFCTQIMESQEAVTDAGMSYVKTTPPPEEDLLFTPLFSIYIVPCVFLAPYSKDPVQKF